MEDGIPLNSTADLMEQIEQIRGEVRGLRAEFEFRFQVLLQRQQQARRAMGGDRVEAVMVAVERQFEVSRAALFRRNPRHEQFAWIRHLLALLLCEYAGLPPASLARAVHRSVSNVPEAIGRARDRISSLPFRRREYEEISRILREGSIPPAELAGERKDEIDERGYNKTVANGAASGDGHKTVSCALDAGGCAFGKEVREQRAEP
jgi:hypothetical protein